MPDRFQDSHIRRIPVFKNLSDYHLQLIAQAFQVRRYNPGDFIFKQGEPTHGLHIFIDGQGVLFRQLPTGQREQLGLIQNGQYINDAAIFQDGTQTANLQVIRPVTALALTRQDMATVLAHYPELRVALGLVASTQNLNDDRFKMQRENEDVLLDTRRHWWAYIRFMWAPLLIAIPFWVLMIYVPAIAPIILPISLFLVIVTGAYLYFEWANDSVKITDQRVIRITRKILTFSQVRDEIAIESIQEANAEIPSLDPFAWIFRYGDVQLKTAGKEGNFKLDFMPNPQSIQKLIMENHSRRIQAKQAGERESMRAELDRWINSQYEAGQVAPVGKPKEKNAANQKKIEDFWTLGDGPISPFITKFPTDQDGTVYRKHWSVWMRAVIIPGLWIVAGLAIFILVAAIPFLREFGIIGFAAAMVMLLFGTVWFYFSDWDWRHDYYVITNSNIIIINQRPLWLQSENEQLLLKQVDNVAAESSGLWQRIFKYGNVRVALVGADEPKIFKNVANPLDVQEEITRRQARMKQQEEALNQRKQRETLGEYFSLYHEATGYNHQPDYTPPDYVPRPASLRDTSRPTRVPRQNPQQPAMSEGRIYQPDNPYGYDSQPNLYPQQPAPQAGYDYVPQPNYPQQSYTPQQPNLNPPLPQQYPPQQPNLNPPLPQQYPQQQPNLNPPLPPLGQPLQPQKPDINPPSPPRDSGRPPRFPTRRNES